MFARLFAEGGLSLDRLRALLEVSAVGSIVKAAGGDPVRQSQFCRQIKELEDFFSVKLVERQGRGIRLTASGRELARISRFFLLALSNFRRGCRAEEQTYHLGAGSTFLSVFLLPAVAAAVQPGPHHAIERVDDDEIERRLHGLTLDFGIVTRTSLSRPLQLKALGESRLILWIPRVLARGERHALAELRARRLPLVWAAAEMPGPASLADYPARVSCPSFLEAQALVGSGRLAGFLPDFLAPKDSEQCLRVSASGISPGQLQYFLAWNPRLLRLNPPAIRARDALVAELAKRVRQARLAG